MKLSTYLSMEGGAIVALCPSIVWLAAVAHHASQSVGGRQVTTRMLQMKHRRKGGRLQEYRYQSEEETITELREIIISL